MLHGGVCQIFDGPGLIFCGWLMPRRGLKVKRKLAGGFVASNGFSDVLVLGSVWISLVAPWLG